MGIFKRKPPSSASASPSHSARPMGSVNALQFDWAAKADPADIDSVRSEWNMNDPDCRDPRAWSNGMRLFETGPPRQRFNAAEYMSRAFCNVLFDPSFMDDDDSVAITIERILVAFDTAEISSDLEAQIAARRIRLVLTVMRERGWQPTALGGSNRMDLDLDTSRIRASLACDGVSSDKSLEHFFGLA